MTPIIDFIAKHFDKIADAWTPGCGITSAAGLLQAITQAQVFRIDDAEFSTTTARTLNPAHFRAGENVVMPSRVVWIEYVAFMPPAMLPSGRSAFLATIMPNGDVRIFGVTLTAANAFIVSAFCEIPADMFGSTQPVEGRRYRVGVSELFVGEGAKMMQIANFFLELLAFIRLQRGLRVHLQNPAAATRRRFRAELGDAGRLNVAHVISFDASLKGAVVTEDQDQ